MFFQIPSTQEFYSHRICIFMFTVALFIIEQIGDNLGMSTSR